MLRPHSSHSAALSAMSPRLQRGALPRQRSPSVTTPHWAASTGRCLAELEAAGATGQGGLLSRTTRRKSSARRTQAFVWRCAHQLRIACRIDPDAPEGPGLREARESGVEACDAA
eukprot:scaffold214_cov249-Pinguiococcus_pyrenoidosus.AAC.2